MVAAQVQKKEGNKSSDIANHTTTFDSTPAENNLLACGIHFRNTITVSDITLSGWTEIGSVVNGSVTKMWYKIAGASEATAVTVDSNTVTAASAMWIAEYSGIDTSTPLDQSNTNSSDNSDVTSLSTGTITTTDANSLLIAMVGTRLAHGGGFGWTDSFTHQADTDSTGGSISGIGWGHRLVTSTGTYSTTGSWSNSIRVVAILANFQESAGIGADEMVAARQIEGGQPVQTPIGLVAY